MAPLASPAPATADLRPERQPVLAAVLGHAAVLPADSQVLWERTHVILPGIDPVSADQELTEGQRAEAVKVNKRVRDSWTTTRRSRRSKSRSRLITHFSRLCGFVQSRPFVDLDLLLDPFFLWPPGDSSVLLIPLADVRESLEDAAARMSRAHPEREFFLTAPDRHPSYQHLDRLRAKFVRSTPAEPRDDTKLNIDKTRSELGLPPLWAAGSGGDI